MAEDSLFTSDYDNLCSLCEEDGERPGLALRFDEQEKNENEKAEFHPISYTENEKETESQKTETVTKEYNEDSAEYRTDDMTEENTSKMDDYSGDVVHPRQQEKAVVQLDSSSPLNLMMVCEESIESGVKEGLLLCPDKPSTLSQSPSTSKNPLLFTISPSDPSVLQLQTQQIVQPNDSKSMPVLQAPCMTKPAYENSPSVEPKTLVHSEQLEMSLQQVYTTRRHTRFTSRSVPLKSVHPETSSQLLPCVSNNSLLVPAPKKKTRTSYSTDQLEELEKMFQDDHYPDADKRKEIAKSVGVTPQRVMVWFQNRRAKWRKTSKMTTKKPPVTRTQPPAQVPVNRPPIFTGSTIAPLPPQTGNSLPPYSTLLTRCTSPPDCVDVTTKVSLGNSADYKHPLMQSPPPLRRSSLPFFAAYNPPTHTLSVLLDTPEHSEPQSFGMHTDIGFNYDSVGSSANYESSGPGTTQSYQLMTYPQPSQQPNNLLHQQSNNMLPQQPNTLLPQYSCMSYLTPSPYLTPNSSEGTATSCMPLNPGTGSNLLPCTNGGHAYFQCQTGSQILLQPGLQALQTYPWTNDLYSQPIQVPHPVLKPQMSSYAHESHFPSLANPQAYITPQGTSCPSLAKSTTPDPLLTSVKTELEETGHSQPGKVSEAETIFHCDFSPIHF